MADLNPDRTKVGDLRNTEELFSVGSMNTEGVNDNKETEYLNPKFTQWYGYYKTIPELKAAIDAKATWTVGKGIKAGEAVTLELDRITGSGVDTFDSILKNMIVISHINGDAYAEIIRNPKSGTLINLKPLDPSSMTVVFNRQGRIKRYEQRNKIGTVKTKKKFQPQEIFHLTFQRVADEIHGTSIIEGIQWVIDAWNEAMADQRKLMHRNVYPMIVWELDEDNPAKVEEFLKKQDEAVKYGERNMAVPLGTAKWSVLSIPPNSTMNPMPWIDSLDAKFWKVVRIPQIIVGGSQEFTEATAKIAYLAFQQNVEEMQKDIEEQVWEQLAIRIELEFPASLENELLSDQKKDKETGATQPNDTAVGVGQE